MRISDWSSDVCPSDLFLIGFAFAALGLFDRTLDIVLRHPARARGDDRGAQPGIHRRIGQARLRRHRDLAAELGKIGRASGRERVCQYVSISVVAVSLKKKTTKV